MKTRVLKVEQFYVEHPTTRGKAASLLRLNGHWLASLGFTPGKTVEVITASGLLVIRKRRHRPVWRFAVGETVSFLFTRLCAIVGVTAMLSLCDSSH